MGILLAATVAATLLLSLIPLKILKEKLASMM
jgi:putative ABC transport system permease protein